MQESRRETRLEVSAHVGTVTSCSSPPGAPTDRSHLSTPAVTRRSAALEDVGTGATEVVHKLDHNPTAPREAEEKGDDCGIEMLDMPPFLVKDINGVGSDAEQHCASPDPSTTKAPCFRRWIDFMRSSVVSVHYDHDVHARICVTNAFGAIVGVTEQMNEHHGKEMSMYGTRVRVVGPEGSDHINHSAEVLRINSEGENMTYTLCLDGGTYVNDTTTASAIITVRDSDTQMDADARESKNNPWTVSGGSGEYYMHGKTFRFSPTTELCQTTDSIPRNVIVWLITSRSFTRVVLVLILLNTAFIGLTDCSVVNESLEPAIYGRSTIPPYEELFSWRNALGIYSENVFTGLFAVEMLLKMVAMGVVLGKGSYLRNGWNWLDCTVVISGLVTALGLPGVAFMRSLRVLRPLKTLTAIPKMRLIVVALLSTLRKNDEISGAVPRFVSSADANPAADAAARVRIDRLHGVQLVALEHGVRRPAGRRSPHASGSAGAAPNGDDGSSGAGHLARRSRGGSSDAGDHATCRAACRTAHRGCRRGRRRRPPLATAARDRRRRCPCRRCLCRCRALRHACRTMDRALQPHCAPRQWKIAGRRALQARKRRCGFGADRGGKGGGA